MSIIECNDLTKEYMSGENVVKAVDGITVSFEQGEFCAVTGPSGSGKSTLLHLLSSLESPTSGDVVYNDKKLSSYNDNQLSILRRRRFGFVFQAYNLVQELTGYENIILPVMLDKKKPDDEYISKIISILGIEDRLEHLPSALSGGQQQRTAIGRAIVKNPDILLCDEPTGALDYNTSKEILQLIEDVNKKYGNTIIMVTHNDAIKQMADRVVKLRDGMIRKNYLNETKLTAAELDW